MLRALLLLMEHGISILELLIMQRIGHRPLISGHSLLIQQHQMRLLRFRPQTARQLNLLLLAKPGLPKQELFSTDIKAVMLTLVIWEHPAQALNTIMSTREQRKLWARDNQTATSGGEYRQKMQ